MASSISCPLTVVVADFETEVLALADRGNAVWQHPESLLWRFIENGTFDQHIGRVLHKSRLHYDPAFVARGGVEYLLRNMKRCHATALSCELLMDCLDLYPEVVAHAPNTTFLLATWTRDAWETGMEMNDPQSFSKLSALTCALVETLGTLLVLRLLMDQDDTPTALRYISCFLEDPDILVSLWPDTLHPILYSGSPCPALVPITSYCCPITLCECTDPVVASDGHTYERDAILRILLTTGESPITRAQLDFRVAPNLGPIRRAHPLPILGGEGVSSDARRTLGQQVPGS